ncbi:MAG: TIGR01777 family oxidoreductase [Desulfobulbaceae bacterium]|nr:TIGR01777 family oxidoreductase [Desulfobulbaceae bacterium]
MKTLITGSSGLVGSALVEFLFSKGYSIQSLRRNPNNEQAHFWATEAIDVTGVSHYNAVIHLAGENVADSRWSSAKKERILNSRVDGTRQLADYISQLAIKPDVFLSASAVGYYGSRGDELLDEMSTQGQGFLSDVCEQWEKETQRLTDMGIRVVNLRFGMVLSPKGGALHKMIPPFKVGLGGVIGDGNQYISWISIRDLIESVAFILKNDKINGPVNIVSPVQTTNKILTQSLGKTLNRPTFFRIPAFVVKVIFGQMADEMLLCSNRTTPKILLEAGFEYKDRSLDETLRFCTDSN